MIRPLTLAAILLAAAAPLAATMPAFAQDGPRDEDRGYDRDDDRDRDRDRDDDRDRDRDRAEDRGGDRDRDRDGDRMRDRDRDRDRERHDGRHMRGEHRPGGPDGMRGPGMRGPGMREMGASFRIELGEGRSLMIRCGDDPLKACIDAAGPLIDRTMTETPAVPSGELPPPPASLATPGEVPPAN